MTTQIIKQYTKREKRFINDVKKCLKKSRRKSLNNHISLLKNIFDNIALLKQYATAQFSTAARMAFISKSILNALVKEGYIIENELSAFYQSLNTVASQYKSDFAKLNLNSFKRKFGHLRSGTYNLTAPKLEDIELKQSFIMDDVKEVFNKKRFLSSLDTAIKYSKISISKDVLYNFLNKSFQLREYLKFEYTKVISITLDMINHLAVILEISAYDLEYLTLDILKSGKNFLNISLLQNKIIMIESADPGYDWIFTHNIKGLITKYGGVGSHMAIRCAEFNLPAAIGCGNKIFGNLLKSKKIRLDSINRQIINVTNNEIFN